MVTNQHADTCTHRETRTETHTQTYTQRNTQRPTYTDRHAETWILSHTFGDSCPAPSTRTRCSIPQETNPNHQRSSTGSLQYLNRRMLPNNNNTRNMCLVFFLRRECFAFMLERGSRRRNGGLSWLREPSGPDGKDFFQMRGRQFRRAVAAELLAQPGHVSRNGDVLADF